MIRSIAASILLLSGLVLAAAPAAAAGADHSATAARASVLSEYAWLWSDKGADERAVTPKRKVIPAAACTMDCCCQFSVGGSTKNQCKSRVECLNAGGICHNKSDGRCK